MADLVLVGVDGSDCGRRAAEFAASRAEAAGARLVLAFVIEWSPYTFNTPEENEVRHRRREEEIARARAQVLDPAVAELAARGLAVESAVRHGHVAQVLHDLAQELGATEIVIGRIGIPRLKALLFGSVAASLVQIAPVPVTVVP